MKRLLASAAFVCLAVPAAHAQSAPSVPGSVAVLRGLDKISGQTRDFNAPVGRTVTFGTLEITARACRRNAPEEPRETVAYLEIADNPPGAEPAGETQAKRLFSGWLFRSSPAANALEHPVYDVWPINCRT